MKKMVRNTRGQNMSLTTILLMVLGVVVLVLLVWGFTSGWGNMWEKITGYTGGKSNVDTIKTACALACQGSQVNAYCSEKRTVRLGDNKKLIGSCENLKGAPVNVAPCAEITCTKENTYEQTCKDLGGEPKETCDGATEESIIEFKEVEGEEPNCCKKI